MAEAACSSDTSPRRNPPFGNSSRRCYRRNPFQENVVTNVCQEKITQKISDLNVVTSAVNADTLAIVTGELVGEAGTQLQLDAVNKMIGGWSLEDKLRT